MADYIIATFKCSLIFTLNNAMSMNIFNLMFSFGLMIIEIYNAAGKEKYKR